MFFFHLRIVKNWNLRMWSAPVSSLKTLMHMILGRIKANAIKNSKIKWTDFDYDWICGFYLNKLRHCSCSQYMLCQQEIEIRTFFDIKYKNNFHMKWIEHFLLTYSNTILSTIHFSFISKENKNKAWCIKLELHFVKDLMLCWVVIDSTVYFISFI